MAAVWAEDCNFSRSTRMAKVRVNECLELSRWLTISVFTFFLIFYAAIARADSSEAFSYICSDGEVYAVRVESWRPNGITSRGPWHKFNSFCSASIRDGAKCAHDTSKPTRRCFHEFRLKGNLGAINGTLAFWPGKIRHSPSSSWFNAVQLTPHQEKDLCAPAIRSLNCAKSKKAVARNDQLKCMYDRSSSDNRATGRNCFTTVNVKLSVAAQEHRRRTRSSQPDVAGR